MKSRTDIVDLNTAWILVFLFSVCASPCLTQTVTLSVRDQLNNRFVFQGETNIQLICEYSGFSSDTSVQILHEGTLIAQGSNSLSGNYTVQADANSAVILTIKMASEYTRGLYNCLVADNDLGVTRSANFNFEVLSLLMSPRCWSSLPTEGSIYVGQPFSADCFYFDSGDSFEGKWVKVLQNGTEIPIVSTVMILPGKKKQTVTVNSVEIENDGVIYKCTVNHKITMLIPLMPCEIGPVIVSTNTMKTPVATSSLSSTSSLLPPTSTLSLSPSSSSAYSTSQVSSERKGLGETTKLTTSRPRVSVTDDPEQESPLDGLLIYIIIGVVVVIFVSIFILISICTCCSRRKGTKEQQRTTKNDPEKVSNVYTTEENLQPSWVYDSAQLTEVKPESPVYDQPPAYKNVDGAVSPVDQSPDEGEYHNIGLSLDDENIPPFVLSQKEMASTYL